MQIQIKVSAEDTITTISAEILHVHWNAGLWERLTASRRLPVISRWWSANAPLPVYFKKTLSGKTTSGSKLNVQLNEVNSGQNQPTVRSESIYCDSLPMYRFRM